MGETWIEKIPWRRERLPTPLFWPGEFHGLRGVTKSRTRLCSFHFQFCLWVLFLINTGSTVTAQQAVQPLLFYLIMLNRHGNKNHNNSDDDDDGDKDDCYPLSQFDFCFPPCQPLTSVWLLGVGVLVTQLCATVCILMNYSPPGFSVHGILQARILEWVAIPSSRGSSQPRDLTLVSCIAGGSFTDWATRECTPKQALLA